MRYAPWYMILGLFLQKTTHVTFQHGAHPNFMAKLPEPKTDDPNWPAWYNTLSEEEKTAWARKKRFLSPEERQAKRRQQNRDRQASYRSRSKPASHTTAEYRRKRAEYMKHYRTVTEVKAKLESEPEELAVRRKKQWRKWSLKYQPKSGCPQI